jgi:hypothetical protein
LALDEYTSQELLKEIINMIKDQIIIL